MHKFSICLPVRNGWPDVKECVESVLQQTYPHFTLHVLDNKSNDNTLSWLQGLDDPRIEIFSSGEELSIVESWARVKNIHKQEFMTLIGHDDVLDSCFLSAISALISRAPEACLYATGGRFINAEGKLIRSCKPVSESETASGYLHERFSFNRDVFGTGYVMRSEEYDRLGGIPSFEKLFFADDALWLSFMNNGKKKVVDPEEYFSIRVHAGSESASLPSVWSPLVSGLRQFHDFLKNYEGDVKTAKVIECFEQSFMLAYHRNAYIFALIESCSDNTIVLSESETIIRESLSYCAPSVAHKLSYTPKVLIIQMLTKSLCRNCVPKLWRIYLNLKNKL